MGAPSNKTAPSRARGTRRGNLPWITDEHKSAARSVDAFLRAAALAGRLYSGDAAVGCPACGRTEVINGGKFKVFPDGGWKHYRCGGRGSALDIVMEAPLNLDFPDAVRAVLGMPTSVALPEVGELPELSDDLFVRFQADPDPEVYHGIVDFYARKAFGGEAVRAAHEFYGQWHIDPEVVDAYGAVYITRPRHLESELLSRFGAERLVACGLFVERPDKPPRSLIGDKWPVIEPGRDAGGTIRNMQFRASNAQHERYLLHKAKKLPYEGNQKFINLRGVRPENYLGCGLDVVAAAEPGRDLFIVEGFKDTLAAATLGNLAYGIPGVSFRPGVEVMKVLTQHNVVLALDGDEAGQEGLHGVYADREGPDGQTIKTLVTPGLVHHFAETGIHPHVHQLRGGMDVTDRLVARHAANGCLCDTCVTFRSKNK